MEELIPSQSIVIVELWRCTFPIEPSPNSVDWSKSFVASSNSSKVNTLYALEPCLPSFAAWDMIPVANRKAYQLLINESPKQQRKEGK